MKIQKITETAIGAALAIILSYIIIFRAPQGGSISLVMVPILWVALKNGLWAGVLCGVVTGSVTFMFGGFFMAPLQVLCDYVLAFGAIGVAGAFSKSFLVAVGQHRIGRVNGEIILSGVLAGVLRLFFHTLAGIVFYSAYAPKGQPVWLYSITYNSLYVIPDTILAIAGVMVLASRVPKLLLRQE
ncbi:Substrate-specific component ThiT of thiamin ECF transporter [Lactobacillus acidipiscis] [Lactiplantibacillus mudanjiangensis]|uniref:energy-coupled thiamine transporter ThiT n=1 Tax=Lactiplantibacillus mudanjiangensis TaxID=1296538 RepID=UPI001014E0D9|nr:energy-coupled thiamine transporter ThiT [Lactiplantibacillus mudanjiangensis]VDG19558.1 Substrate-specific component ThiT of thiamin ECF transporter [Lactobacillus acidipiscis] [Lactiplantibacillus mudanjiangensis]VDG31006.1 Substrate-specific component ThiT of thiamin ECF transporter [Lactobacillus acidipiscis] [Lactiplantibacillus mudanjiangensis]